MSSDDVQLEIVRGFPGRVVLAQGSGVIYQGHNYEIQKSNDGGASWTATSSLPRSSLRRLAEKSRLACRLVRQEIRALAVLPDGTHVASNREGIFHGREGDPIMTRCAVENEGLPVMPPMRISVGPGDLVLWGEYGSPRKPRDVRLFASRDGGRSFQAFHTLEAGSVLHVHNIVYDAPRDHFWVLAGDHDAEPGIGQLSSDLARFEWFVKGEQRYRACEIFDFGDRLLYATDTEMEQNGLVSLDKSSGRIEWLRDFEGSCIYACRFGDLYAITTAVEPSPVNLDAWVSLWLSRDGVTWKRAYRAEKDRWNAHYFQFGSLILPSGTSDQDLIFFSGQAVKGIDGKTLVARIAPGESL